MTLFGIRVVSFSIMVISFTVAVLIPIWLGTGTLTGLQILSVFLISLLSGLLGNQFSRLLRVYEIGGFNPSLQLVIGFTGLSFLEILGIYFFELDPIQAFITSGCLIFASLILNYKSIFSEIDCFLKPSTKNMAIDAAVLVFISVLTSLWCRELITSVKNAHQAGVFSVWPDIFLHSSEIVSLQNHSVLSNQSLYLAGTEQNFYHIASYALSALYASINSELALDVSTYFWTPVGIILMGLAVYGFGCSLAGRVTGFLVTAAIFLLPDAAMYGAKISYFGFHWLMQISPGSGYAIALVLVALALYVRGVRDSRFDLILCSIPIVLLSAVFRVQIAAPAAVMFLFLISSSWQPAKAWHRKALYFTIASILIFTVLLFESIELAPHFLSGDYTASKFFEAIHATANKASYSMGITGEIYRYLTNSSPVVINWLIGYGMFLGAGLGLLLPAVAVWTIIKLRSKNELLINIIPVYVLMSCFMIIVFLPVPADGDFSNFGHRQFVLIYVIFMSMLIYWISLSFNKYLFEQQFSGPAKNIIIACLIVVGFFVPWKYGKGIQQPKNWALNITKNFIPQGLFKSTIYIRQHSKIQDWVLSSNLDSLAKVVSLTERSAFLSRESLHQRLGGEHQLVYKLRKAEFEHMKIFKDYADLKSFGLKNNIKWFLQHPNDMQGWSIDILHCAIFESGGFRVYNLQKNSFCSD